MLGHHGLAQMQQVPAAYYMSTPEDTTWWIILNHSIGDVDIVYPAMRENLGRPWIWSNKTVFWKKVEVEWWPEPVNVTFQDRVRITGDMFATLLNPKNSKEKNEKLLGRISKEYDRYLMISVRDRDYNDIVKTEALKVKFESWFWSMIHTEELP